MKLNASLRCSRVGGGVQGTGGQGVEERSKAIKMKLSSFADSNRENFLIGTRSRKAQ